MFRSIQDLESEGFEGFAGQIRLVGTFNKVVPVSPGVLLAVWADPSQPPTLREESNPFHMPGKKPRLSLDYLRERWVEDTCVLYIDEAGPDHTSPNLRQLIRKLLWPTGGPKAARSRGRLIWHMVEVEGLEFCWSSEHTGAELIANFKNEFGRAPFANTKD